MALQLSTLLRNALLSQKVATANGGVGSACTASSSPNTASITGSGFVTAGFMAGDTIFLNSVTVTVNHLILTIYSVTDTTIVVCEASVVSSETAVNAVTKLNGGGFRDIMKTGVIRIYTGTQPLTADLTESGTLLVKITLAGGAHNTTTGINGLMFEEASAAGVLLKETNQVWSGVAGNTGTAGWFRFYSKADTTGGSGVNFDGVAAMSGGQLTMATTSVVSGATQTIDSFSVTLPAA